LLKQKKVFAMIVILGHPFQNKHPKVCPNSAGSVVFVASMLHLGTGTVKTIVKAKKFSNYECSMKFIARKLV